MCGGIGSKRPPDAEQNTAVSAPRQGGKGSPSLDKSAQALGPSVVIAERRSECIGLQRKTQIQNAPADLHGFDSVEAFAQPV